MTDYQRLRPLILAEYIVATASTIRETAAEFGVPRSTVYKDVTEILKKINPQLFENVKIQLEINKHEGCVKGGKTRQAKLRELKKNPK